MPLFLPFFSSDRALPMLPSQEADDEMRRTFAFRCRLLPENCAFRSQSFGSEAKAKADMKRHLAEHVAAMSAEAALRLESVVARRRKSQLAAAAAASSAPATVKVERDPGTPPPPRQTEPPPPPAAPVSVKQGQNELEQITSANARVLPLRLHIRTACWVAVKNDDGQAALASWGK